MSEKDLESVCAIEKECFRDAWSPDQFENAVKGNTQKILVLENDGIVLGFGVIMTVLDECEILRIAVKNEYRRKGLGSVLLDSMLEQARENGAGIFYLEVRASNDPARMLYEKKGFTETGRRKDYYTNPKEDAVLMSLVRPVSLSS